MRGPNLVSRVSFLPFPRKTRCGEDVCNTCFWLPPRSVSVAILLDPRGIGSWTPPDILEPTLLCGHV